MLNFTSDQTLVWRRLREPPLREMIERECYHVASGWREWSNANVSGSFFENIFFHPLTQRFFKTREVPAKTDWFWAETTPDKRLI